MDLRAALEPRWIPSGSSASGADVGYAAGYLRLLMALGLLWKIQVAVV